jgi:hypothetical protein
MDEGDEGCGWRSNLLARKEGRIEEALQQPDYPLNQLKCQLELRDTAR